MEVSTQDFHASVQAGVTRGALNSYLRDTGLFFPVGKMPEMIDPKLVLCLALCFFSLLLKMWVVVCMAGMLAMMLN